MVKLFGFIAFNLLVLSLFVFSSLRANAEKGQTIESYLQSLSTLPDITSRRDPFEQPPSPFQPKAKAVVNIGIDPNAPVLVRFPLEQYVVVAVLLGDVYPRALVQAPTGAKSVLIIKEKDRLGNGGGIITKITENGLVVTQKKRDESGFVEKVDITLPVGNAGKATDSTGATSGGVKSGT